MAQSKMEKIASIEEEIRQLKERQKLLKQQHNLQERKDRTKRLCRRILDGLTAQNATTANPQGAQAAAHGARNRKRNTF